MTVLEFILILLVQNLHHSLNNHSNSTKFNVTLVTRLNESDKKR